MKNAIKTAAVALVIYGLASSGLLALWCDESGCGVQVYSIGGYYVQGAGL